MKKNILYYICVVALSMTSLTSCEDYMTEINPNRTTDDTFGYNLKDTQSGIYAAYAALRNDYVVGIREEAWRSDMGWPGYGRPVAQGNNEGWTIYTQTLNNSTSYVNRKWNALYVGVWRANQVINNLENKINRESLSLEDQKTWDYQMGQAKFFRGLMYFYLSSSFNNGSVILKKTVPASTNEFHQGLSSAEEVLDFYRTDLEEAYRLLPAKSPSGKEYVGLATKGTAATILGNSYMYHKEYTKAAEYYKDVIENKAYGYSLEMDLDKMFTTAGEFNSESILEISYSDDLRQEIGTWDDNCMYNRLNSMTTNTVGCLVPAWLIWEYEHEEMDEKVAENHIDNDLNAPLKAVPLRASAMVALPKDVTTPYYITDNAAQQANMYGGPKAEWGFGKYKKYTNHDICTSEKALISGKNVVLNRLSDVYLMYAECLLQQDNVQGALDYINDIRYRWGLVLMGHPKKYTNRTYDDMDYTKDQVMEHLMDVERPLELSAEGYEIRWQDLLRWGQLEDNGNNRFNILANSEKYQFWTASFASKKLDGTAGRNIENCIITKMKSGDKSQFINYEYDDASNNYKNSTHAYLPIPLNEIMNNSELK